jgi:tRNA A-37 threonylcarbamoyl transferase component Bud32
VKRTPEGFRRVEAAGAILVVAERFASEVESLDLPSVGGLDRWRASGARVEGGRARSVRVLLPRSQTSVHLRPLVHGGWLRALTGRRFLGIARSLQELAAASALCARGVPVPEPVLLLARRRGVFWHVDVGNRFAPGVALERWLAGAPGSASVSRAARSTGRALRRLHDAGGSHADLHLGNLLVDPSDLDAVTIVDLDRSRLRAEVPAAHRMRELMRLERSLRKHRSPDLAQFFDACLEGYTSGDEGLRASLLAHRAREQVRNALHGFARPRGPVR